MRTTDKLACATAGLAERPAFSLGTLLVVPATRQIRGPDGNVFVQPRVMHVLLALFDAEGRVVTRDALAERCWGGRFVAEDSVNGAIAELRKALRTVSAKDVSLETIPRTGYRLARPDNAEAPPIGTSFLPGLSLHKSRPGLSRRLLLVGAVAAVGGAGLFGWKAIPSADSEVGLLIERGSQALRQGLPESGAEAVVFFRKAAEHEPNNAKAWGMLALAWRAAAEYGEPAVTTQARAKAETAARRALAIDPRQSDALTALATLTPFFGNWIDSERGLRNVLAIDPGNVHAVAALSTLFMSTGQVRASLNRLDWLTEADPLSPNLQFRRIYTLWSVGRLSEMDRLADRALQSWPQHPAVWFARFWTLAFTGRSASALAMLTDSAARPAMPPAAVRGLEVSLRAIGSRKAADVGAAVASNVAAAERGPGQATAAIMVLSQLGASDAALRVARGFLLRQGPMIVQQRHTAAQASITDQHHRVAMMLWVPATENLRLQAGFRALCDGIGLVDYWRETGRRPDFKGGDLSVG